MSLTEGATRLASARGVALRPKVVETSFLSIWTERDEYPYGPTDENNVGRLKTCRDGSQARDERGQPAPTGGERFKISPYVIDFVLAAR